ncbi:MAG: rRNA maturation RNase YbeY [Deltaproteobacteria bacterium]|nr:rRNA maturation RNase YbeY [Deltaproteobacteria bacterium]
MFFLNNHQAFRDLDLEQVRRMLQTVLEELGLEKRDLEVELVDDDAIADLNEKFFSRLRPTNVISFPLEEETGGSGQGAGGPLGSIVVSVETATRETGDLGYSVEEGVVYYLIHGLLHLIGYEHIGVAAEDAARMEKRQDELFSLALR